MKHPIRHLGGLAILISILCLPIPSQGQAKSVPDSIHLLQQLLPELPLTKVKSRGNSAAKSNYVLSVDFEKECMTVEDQRILNRTGQKSENDGYLITLPFEDLHRDGILLLKEEAKRSISLSILAAGNKKTFTVMPLLTKEENLSFPQDRLLLGPWPISTPNIEAQLERIKSLMSWIAKKEGTKRKKYRPSFEREDTHVFTSKAVNAAPLQAGSKATSKTALPIAKMEQPPLFQDSKELKDVAPAVKSYLLQQIKAKDIQLQFAVQGKFIVNEAGRVSFVKIDFAMDKGARQLIERILKEMPAWKVGMHEGRTRSALIPFSLEAKKE